MKKQSIKSIQKLAKAEVIEKKALNKVRGGDDFIVEDLIIF